MHKSGQQQLPFRTWGGKRRRPRRNAISRASVPHLARPTHNGRHPAHVTLRAVRRLPSLRRQTVFREVLRALPRTGRSWFRIIHFSVQADHVHLLVEANDKTSLSRGVAGACIRLARTINRVMGRQGRVWSDRFHARALRTPREVRNGIVYVLMNWKKHVPRASGFDRFSSVFWFDGWVSALSRGPPPAPVDDVPVEPARTWLLRTGWKRHGRIGSDEQPKVGS